MDEYNTKNYTEQGGEVTHINGTLMVGEDATVTGLPIANGLAPGIIKANELTRDAVSYTVEVRINPETGMLYVPAYPKAAAVAPSTATTVGDLRNSLNALITSLTEAGLMDEDGQK